MRNDRASDAKEWFLFLLKKHDIYVHPRRVFKQKRIERRLAALKR